jgi:hypothetical protein
MGLSGSLVTFSGYLFAMMQANYTALGLEGLFYGDQAKIPLVPAVCVDSNGKQRTIARTSRGTDVNLTAFIIIYHSLVSDVQVTRREVDTLAEQIEAIVHADPQLGGNVIHSLVSTMQSGYATKSGAMFRSCRLTVTGLSQEQLPRSS